MNEKAERTGRVIVLMFMPKQGEEHFVQRRRGEYHDQKDGNSAHHQRRNGYAMCGRLMLLSMP